MAMKVPVSFKENEKEMYEFLVKQLSPSIFIKQLIKNEMGKENQKASKTTENKTNLLDF